MTTLVFAIIVAMISLFAGKKLKQADRAIEAVKLEILIIFAAFKALHAVYGARFDEENIFQRISLMNDDVTGSIFYTRCAREKLDR